MNYYILRQPTTPVYLDKRQNAARHGGMNRKEKKMYVATVRLPESVQQTLKELAEEDMRPFSSYLAKVLTEHAKAKRPAKTKKERKE